jgi:hypothetical protein
MRLLVHRGQALLLLVVGVLAGAVVGGAVLERDGLPAPIVTRLGSLLTPPRHEVPVRIQIAGPVPAPVPSTSEVIGQPQPVPVAVEPPSPPAAVPHDDPTVVPAAIYSYPPDDGGHRGSGHSGRR